MGHIILADARDGTFWVGEVKELVKQVWVEGSAMVGDVIVHEYGSKSSGMGLKGKQMPRWKSKGKKKSRSGAVKEYDQYAAKSPGTSYHPVLATVWAESIVSWGQDYEMLGVGRMLLKKAIDELPVDEGKAKGKNKVKATGQR